MNLKITPETTVGEVVAADYRTASVFEQHGIDFCCGGKIAIANICKEKGVDPVMLIEKLKQVQDAPLDRSTNYAGWTLSFLADYIVNTHHSYLYEVDDQLVAYTAKIAQVHGGHHPELIRIAELFSQIARDLATHLKEEEELLFPAIKRAEAARKAGDAASAADTEIIRNNLVKLHKEHEEVGDAVHEIRHLSNNFTLPSDACNSFMLTYKKLEEFDADIHKHVHLENNILFLKAATL